MEPLPPAANPPYRLPPPLFSARCRACWFVAALALLVVASFWSLDLQWSQFLSWPALQSMGRFVGEFFPPDTSAAFLAKVGGESFFAGPQELRRYQIAETEQWKRTAARAGIQPE